MVERVDGGAAAVRAPPCLFWAADLLIGAFALGPCGSPSSGG